MGNTNSRPAASAAAAVQSQEDAALCAELFTAASHGNDDEVTRLAPLAQAKGVINQVLFLMVSQLREEGETNMPHVSRSLCVIQFPSKHMETALYRASHKGCYSTVAVLLAHGADPRVGRKDNVRQPRTQHASATASPDRPSCIAFPNSLIAHHCMPQHFGESLSV